MMPRMSNKANLLIEASETNADLLWATRFFVPDPIIYFEWKGKSYLVASDLEFSRAKKEANVEAAKIVRQSDKQPDTKLVDENEYWEKKRKAWSK